MVPGVRSLIKLLNSPAPVPSSVFKSEIFGYCLILQQIPRLTTSPGSVCTTLPPHSAVESETLLIFKVIYKFVPICDCHCIMAHEFWSNYRLLTSSVINKKHHDVIYYHHASLESAPRICLRRLLNACITGAISVRWMLMLELESTYS